MRILFIVPYVPNLIRVRPYNLIRYLAERGHEVTLLTLQSHPSEAADIETLRPQLHQLIALDLPKWRSLWNCLQALPSRRPLQSVFCWQPQMGQLLQRLVGADDGRAPFDLVHVEHLRGVTYGLHLKKWAPTMPVIWDSVDCISFLFEQAIAQSKSGFGRLITRLDLGRTRRFEASVVDAFEQVLVTSPADREAFIRLRPSTAPLPPITVLPNGVDLDSFRPDTAVVRQPATVVVSGKMSYHANITMVLHLIEQIMPLVWQQRPEAQLLVVGKDPAPALQKFASHPNITVTGTVPSIVPYLQQATVCVAPIPYGAGIQNKVLEAMACATPVVMSSQAAKALTAVAGQAFLLADAPDVFAAHIVSVLNQPAWAQTIGQTGYEFVHSQHNWRQIAAQLEQLYGRFFS